MIEASSIEPVSQSSPMSQLASTPLVSISAMEVATTAANQVSIKTETGQPCSAAAVTTVAASQVASSAENSQPHTPPPTMLTPYPMMPQLMPVQIVQTSSGPMQVQPFIHNGQFGIAQLSPYRPQHMQNVAPLVNSHPTLHWRPQYYSSYNVGCRMMSPDQIKSPSPLYNQQQGLYPVPPTFLNQPVGKGATKKSANANSSAVQQSSAPSPLPPRLPSSMPVCQQIKLQQQIQQNLQAASGIRQPPPLDEKPFQASITSGRKVAKPAPSHASNCDPRDQICAMAGLQPQATITVGHLKSPDSGFGETGIEVNPSSESEVSP